MQVVVQRSRSSRRLELVSEICDYIKADPTSKITLASLGKHFGLSSYHLQKVFTEVMGISPRKYLEECRVGVLKLRLAKGEPVLGALRGTGYSSQSWLYQDSRTKLGMTPAAYRSGAPGELIAYATGDCSIGRLLVAATMHGVCSVNVGTNDAELVASLKREYPKSSVVETSDARLLLEGVRSHLRGQRAKLPLDIRGTDFQLKVWTALQRIPIGETRTYSEVAKMIGEPRAIRAVANACASNPVPLIVPCHRVIRKNGNLGGYALGLQRKRTLLRNEHALTAKKTN